MVERSTALHATADEQIVELIALLSTVDEDVLRLPCDGREKLGDGSVGAVVTHTADNYRRIAVFVQAAGDRIPAAHQPGQHGAHRMPRFLRGLGHGPAEHDQHGPTDHDQHGPGPGPGQHENRYTADNFDRGAVIALLSSARDGLAQIAALTDSQLDAIPPEGSFRFCDGQRTLEEVITCLLTHQRHQLDAIPPPPSASGPGEDRPQDSQKA